MLSDLKEMEQIYCLEIPKGISVIISYNQGNLGFYRQNTITKQDTEDITCLFDKEEVLERLNSFDIPVIRIYGHIVGPNLTYRVNDVILNEDYISVLLAKEMCKFLKFDFVPYSIVSPKEAEFQTGVILRPIQECVDEDGNRIIEEIK